MNDTYIVSIVTFIYFFAAFFYLVSLILRRGLADRTASLLLLLGIAVHTIGIVFRWIQSYQLGIGHAPLSNFYESLVFFSWSIIFICLLLMRRNKNGFVGVVASFSAFIILAYASLSGRVEANIQPLVPALQSNWLISHVVSSFLAYACFTISFGSSILYLISPLIKLRTRRELWDEINYKMISIGFVLLTLGIITGAAWADRAWGRYWGWDPKETWSLITWLVYGAFLHARLVKGWKGVRMSIISILGFMAVIFTYLGVNYILSGLHSYL
ncbi:MAG: cytochrome c biogenesis protein [Deltaproteobacteria bacterium]|nr:cytochrome c biogenesis protein [Deltaproteobacteria bacterium]